MEFKGDIIITDPCYIMRAEHHGTKPITKNDWGACNYGQHMEVLGIQTYLSSGTIYGDWSCTTFNSDTGETLGEFCADAGMVSVFLLDEVLKYNPDFDYHIKRPWTTTLIKNFDGEITIELTSFLLDNDCYDSEEDFYDEEIRVIGKGNINFYTTQTGL